MQDLADRYRQLVVAEESVETLDLALALAEDVAGIRLQWTAGRLEARTENDQRLSVDLPELARVRARRRRTRPRLEKQARAVRAAVMLAAVPDLADDMRPSLGRRRQSLVADTCLVVFHQACFALLPELSARDWVDERRLLTESFPRFASHLERISDRYSVLALYHDVSGDWERAGRYYREALLATHSDDHEFMTTLQSSWSFLVEHQMLQQAFDLLLESYPRVARQDLDEVKELMTLTFVLQRRFYEQQLDQRGHDRGSGGALLRPGSASVIAEPRKPYDDS